MRKEMDAPTVAAANTRMVPRTRPKMAPAARVRSEPGTNTTHATTYPTANAIGAQTPRRSTDAAKAGMRAPATCPRSISAPPPITTRAAQRARSRGRGREVDGAAGPPPVTDSARLSEPSERSSWTKGGGEARLTRAPWSKETASTSRCWPSPTAAALARLARLRYRSRSTPRLRRSEEHTSELQSRENLVCRLLLEKKKKKKKQQYSKKKQKKNTET